MTAEINQAIQDHYGFIIQTVSETLGRYVHVHNDDAFSVALIAFEEAYRKYDEDKGPFLPYVKLVIKSRLIDHIRREKRHQNSLSLDQLTDEGVQVADANDSHQADYSSELTHWQQALMPFGITMENLVEESPQHEDTRQRAISISLRSSQYPPITEPLYKKKRLPIKVTADYNNVTTKVIQRSKTLIISVIVMVKEECQLLIQWIRKEDA
ncbi:sigma factor [Hutsoniella sourekii]